MTALPPKSPKDRGIGGSRMTDALAPSNLKLQVISIISDLAKANPLGLARCKTIVDAITEDKSLGMNRNAASTMIHRLFYGGWIERPFPGSYRLTANAERELEKWLPHESAPTVNCVDCKRGISCPDWDEANYCTAGIEK